MFGLQPPGGASHVANRTACKEIAIFTHFFAYLERLERLSLEN
jgi:hypothetical protein